MIGAQETVQETVGDIQTGFGATGWGGIGGGIASGCCCYWGGGARREPCSASVGFRTGT